jgi:hypothetical protein
MECLKCRFWHWPTNYTKGAPCDPKFVPIPVKTE